MKYLILLLCIGLFASDTLIVGVSEFSPCVIIEEGVPRGFDIELWEEIASFLTVPFKYKVIPEFKDIFSNVSSGKVDIAISGITINAERESFLDFTQPYLKSGISVLVRKEGEANVFQVLGGFFLSIWKTLLIFFGFLLLCSVLIWYFELGKDSFDDKPIKGIAEGMYWTNVTMTTVGYGDQTPQTAKGKLFSVIVMWIGICIVFPFVVAKMGQIVNMDYSITEQSELKNKKVAIIEGTTSLAAAKALSVKITECKGIEHCYDLLESKKVEAIICDTPVLKYLVKIKGQGKLKVLEKALKKEDYGIVMRQGSKQRELINRELLKVKEQSLKYKYLHKKWFGE